MFVLIVSAASVKLSSDHVPSNHLYATHLISSQFLHSCHKRTINSVQYEGSYKIVSYKIKISFFRNYKKFFHYIFEIPFTIILRSFQVLKVMFLLSTLFLGTRRFWYVAVSTGTSGLAFLDIVCYMFPCPSCKCVTSL